MKSSWNCTLSRLYWVWGSTRACPEETVHVVYNEDSDTAIIYTSDKFLENYDILKLLDSGMLKIKELTMREVFEKFNRIMFVWENLMARYVIYNDKLYPVGKLIDISKHSEKC